MTQAIWANHCQDFELCRRLDLHEKKEEGAGDIISENHCSQLPEEGTHYL